MPPVFPKYSTSGGLTQWRRRGRPDSRRAPPGPAASEPQTAATTDPLPGGRPRGRTGPAAQARGACVREAVGAPCGPCALCRGGGARLPGRAAAPGHRRGPPCARGPPAFLAWGSHPGCPAPASVARFLKVSENSRTKGERRWNFRSRRTGANWAGARALAYATEGLLLGTRDGAVARGTAEPALEPSACPRLLAPSPESRAGAAQVPPGAGFEPRGPRRREGALLHRCRRSTGPDLAPWALRAGHAVAVREAHGAVRAR